MFHKDNSSVSLKGKRYKDVPIRKSDRKNLRQRVSKNLLTPSSSEDAHTLTCSTTEQSIPSDPVSAILDDVFLNGTLVSRQVNLPSSGKATLYYRGGTCAGTSKNDRLVDPTTHYSWPYSSTQCVWIELSDGWNLPSLALLSALPLSSLSLPTVIIPSQASQYLCRGANLMRAGVIRIVEPNRKPTVEDDDSLTNNSVLQMNSNYVAAVCVSGNPQPFAVGILNYAHDFWTRRQGVAVTIVSVYGDDLWRQQQQQVSISSTLVTTTASKDATTPGVVNPVGGAQYNAGHYGNVGFLDGKRIVPIVDSSERDAPDSDDNSSASAPDDDDEPSPTADVERPSELAESGSPGPLIEEGEEADTNPALVSPQTKPSPTIESPSLTSPDDLLHRAVCRALVRLNKSDLPMTVSNFYASHVLPNRDQGSTIELKQTQWKKFSVYLKEQVGHGLVTVAADAAKKDPMAQLTGYNKRHVDLKPFVAEYQSDPNRLQDTAPTKLVLVNLYIIPRHWVTLLRLDADAVAATEATSDERKGTGKLTLKEARQILEDYIVRENLIQPNNPNRSYLDGPLTEAVYKTKKASGASPSPPPESLTRKELADQWMSKLERAYALVELPSNRIVQMNRGVPPVVTLEVSRRQSNKFVTIVLGLKQYHIDATTLANDVATRFACATSVDDDVPHSNNKKVADDPPVLVQGNLSEELLAYLVGDEKLTTHGGAKGSPYRLPKNAVTIVLKKGVPSKKNKGK